MSSTTEAPQTSSERKARIPLAFTAIFTSNPVPPNVSASENFRQHGNTTDSATRLSDVLLVALKTNISSSWTGYKSHITQHMAASVQDKTLMTSDNGYFPLSINVPNGLFVTPRVAISFNGPLQQDKQEKLFSYGFVKQSAERNLLYIGIITPQNAADIVAMRPNLDGYAPFGTCTLRGYMAFVMTCNLLEIHIRSVPFWSVASEGSSLYMGGGSYIHDAIPHSLNEDTDVIEYTAFDSKYTNKSKKPSTDNSDYDEVYDKCIPYTYSYIANPTSMSSRAASFSDPSSLPRAGGVFFPYFNGLIVEDKNIGPSIIGRHYATALGKDVDSSLSTLDSIRKGYSTLVNTTVGKEISHALFVVDIAMEVGCRPLLYTRGNGEYLGTVLLGRGFKIRSHGRTYEPLERDELVDQLLNYNGHETALLKLCQILCTIPLREDRKKMPEVLPADLSSIRAIHNVIRSVEFTAEHVKEISQLLPQLSFPMNFWMARDTVNLSSAIQRISKGTFLPDTAPMLNSAQYVFCRDSLPSTLAAFGSLAPSFIMEGGTLIPIQHSSGKSVLEFKNPKGVSILGKGLPVYIKPLQQAIADWGNMARQHYIKVKVTARGDYINVARLLPRRDSNTVAAMLSDAFGEDPNVDRSTVQKRKAQEEAGPSKKRTAIGPVDGEISEFFGKMVELGQRVDIDEDELMEE